MPRGHILDLRWNALLNEFRRSGLTHAEFCQRRGISIHSFRKRLYQPATPKPTPANSRSSDGTAACFLPVTILPDPIPATPVTGQPIELLLGNGRRIAVAPGFDPLTLRQLIAVVEERPCSD
jgi:hypothetical protein